VKKVEWRVTKWPNDRDRKSEVLLTTTSNVNPVPRMLSWIQKKKRVRMSSSYALPYCTPNDLMECLGEAPYGSVPVVLRNSSPLSVYQLTPSHGNQTNIETKRETKKEKIAETLMLPSESWGFGFIDAPTSYHLWILGN
jgi:hypothetical protein